MSEHPPAETPAETPGNKPEEAGAPASLHTSEAVKDSALVGAAEASIPSRLDAARAAVTDFWRDEVTARPLGFAVDVASLALVAWALWWFADNDGGLPTADLRQFSILALLLTPFLADELRRAPRPVRIALVALPIGALLSFAFAVERSRFVADALTFGSVPVLVLVGARLSRRRWTLGAALGIVVLGFASWSWLAGLKWWGWTDLGVQPRWEFVSWRNPGGALSAAFGVWLGGLCIAGNRSPSLIAGGAAGLGLAGAWLSTSRAAPLAGAAGLALVAVLWILSSDDRVGTGRSTAGRVAGIAGASVAAVLLLQLMLPAAATSPIASREPSQSVSTNAGARTNHWEAAANMFVDRPVTGQGIGSFRGVMERFNPADGNLTAAAHSVWFEGLAEGGLAFGLPLLLLGALAAAGVLGLPGTLRTVESSEFNVGPAMVLGGAGAAAVLLAHASIDFDFRYLSILAMACVGMGLVLGARRPVATASEASSPPDGARSRPLHVLALVPAVGLLGVGLWGAVVESRPLPRLAEATTADLVGAYAPWNTANRAFVSNLLMQRGELEAALEVVEPTAKWSPSDPAAVMAVARARYRLGEITGQDLLNTLELPPTKLNQWVQTAELLLAQGDLRPAEIAARQTIDFHPAYAAWGLEQTVARAWLVLIEVAVRAEGCDVAPDLLDAADAQGFDRSGQQMEGLRAVVQRDVCPVG